MAAVTQQQKLPKHLPKRTRRPRGKAYRAVLRAQQEKRKDANRKAQAERERINKERGYTSWEAAKAARKARRASK